MKADWKGPKTGEYIGVNMILIQCKTPETIIKILNNATKRDFFWVLYINKKGLGIFLGRRKDMQITGSRD